MEKLEASNQRYQRERGAEARTMRNENQRRVNCGVEVQEVVVTQYIAGYTRGS